MTDNREELVRFLQEALEPAGWRVETSSSDPHSVRIVLQHPLSSEIVVSLPYDQATAAFAETFLTRSEFDVVAKAPEVPHATLIGKIRDAAGAWGWDRADIAGIARILRSEELLTEAEADWLELAGPVVEAPS
jgi:hypothetical protein